MAVSVVVDSTCAPSLQTALKLDITIVPINIHLGDRVYQDLFEIEPDRFYRELVAADELPTTSAPSTERFSEAFRKILGRGDSVFCLTVTAELSNTYNVAAQASGELPGEEASRIQVFDSEAAGAAATHADVEHDLDLLTSVIKKMQPGAEIETIPFTPAMGAHAGPGIIGIAYLYY